MCLSGLSCAFLRLTADLGPNELSIRNASAIPALLGISGVPKGPGAPFSRPGMSQYKLTANHYPAFIGGMLSNKNLPMIGIMDTEEHLRRRRAWNRGLSSAALAEYHGLVKERASQLVRSLEEQLGEIILGDWVNKFACVHDRNHS